MKYIVKPVKNVDNGYCVCIDCTNLCPFDIRQDMEDMFNDQCWSKWMDWFSCSPETLG